MMKRTLSWMILALMVVTVSTTQAATASERETTTITLQVLQCESCAKKVAQSLYQVPGVASVKTDVKTKSARVLPKSGSTPSPRLLWEAVERAGKQPVKLTGPSGTFTSKPRS
ncbi:MAG: heavy-metal-associated domain-containing protein [Planctomycetaceae bacterium]|nr:heavy-metal-associated domain-containing protein [Planctomycetaceae bacterium]